MGGGTGGELFLRFGERDVQALLAGFHAFEKVLKRERGFAGAGVAIDQIEAMRNEPAFQNIIESRDASLRWLDTRLDEI